METIFLQSGTEKLKHMKDINNFYQQFTAHAVAMFKPDPAVIGLAVGGSWISDEMDNYSDLDLVLVTKDKVSGKEEMLAYANRLGDLLSAFTGEHVGESRLLICLYNNPLLHVDIKFLTIEELNTRVENPVILLDKNQQLQHAIQGTPAVFPYPNYQWIEDRFWTWIHYILLKIGRGEYFEAHDFLAFLRSKVFGPLLHIHNGNLPRGVRKVESSLRTHDLDQLKLTLASCNKPSLITATENAIVLYRQLRSSLFGDDVILQRLVEVQITLYLEKIKHS